jgi:hypothetical protein
VTGCRNHRSLVHCHAPLFLALRNPLLESTHVYLPDGCQDAEQRHPDTYCPRPPGDRPRKRKDTIRRKKSKDSRAHRLHNLLRERLPGFRPFSSLTDLSAKPTRVSRGLGPVTYFCGAGAGCWAGLAGAAGCAFVCDGLMPDRADFGPAV